MHDDCAKDSHLWNTEPASGQYLQLFLLTRQKDHKHFMRANKCICLFCDFVIPNVKVIIVRQLKRCKTYHILYYGVFHYR